MNYRKEYKSVNLKIQSHSQVIFISNNDGCYRKLVARTIDRIQAELYWSIILHMDHMQDRGASNDI